MSHNTDSDWARYFSAQAERCMEPALTHFFQAGVVDAQTPIIDVPLLALDVETTGLDPHNDAIISLGVIPFDICRIRCCEARYWVVKPTVELSEESVTYHHITHSELQNAPSLKTVLHELLDAMQGHITVVHYRNIERGFLDQACQHHFNETFNFPLIDTMELEARLYPNRQPSRLARLFGRKATSIRLDDSRKRYHLPSYHAHHALSDTLATAELLQAQIATHYSPETPLAELWQ